MRQAVVAALLLTSLCQTPALAAEAASGTATPLIPREAIFGNPARSVGRISPDGRWLSWLAPKDGVLNIWVAPADNPSQARAVSAEKTRPIRFYYWSPDSAQVLYNMDDGGDENFKLHSVNVHTGQHRVLTPFPKVRNRVVGISPQVADRILVGLNHRDPRWHDVYSIDLKTGALTLVQQNDGYADFIADRNLNLRLAAKARDDGGTDYHRIMDGAIEPKPFLSIGLEDSLTTLPLGFNADGKTLYWMMSSGRDKAALVAQDMTNGKQTILGQSGRADVSDVLADPKTGEMQAYAVNYLETQWTALAPKIAPDIAFLQEKLNGEIEVTSRTLADDRWMVSASPTDAPPATYLYDRQARVLTRLFSTLPQLEAAPLVDMHSVEMRSRDGLTLTGYVSLPPGSDADGNARPDRPVPMVLLVHGGPWGRDTSGFTRLHQWLANRGYAVLSVNFRGSTGFGKSFISAGDLEWGGKMHDDLIDAVDWAIGQGIAAKDKVAIMGGSYGGYATLVGMTFTPERFACGVDIVGPSNLFTLLETIPPYWEALRRQFYRRMGDPTTEEGRALLRDRSPLFRVDAIKRPLLIGQGANDPRVNVRESDQIVAAMTAKNIPVTYALYPDEGHGFARPENNIAFMAIAENFLQPCLGGRAEPIGAALKGSSVRIQEGAAHVPGLEAAVAASAASTPPAAE